MGLFTESVIEGYDFMSKLTGGDPARIRERERIKEETARLQEENEELRRENERLRSEYERLRSEHCERVKARQARAAEIRAKADAAWERALAERMGETTSTNPGQ